MQIDVARAFATPADDGLVGHFRADRAAKAPEPGPPGLAGLTCLAASAGARGRDAS